MISVLIVDDDTTVSNSLVAHFEDCGYQVSTVESAEEALCQIENTEFDVMIVDLRLPGITGDEFVEKIYYKTRKTIFIIYSGSIDYIFKGELLKLTRVSSNFFQKPIVDLSLLNKEIEGMLKKSDL